jgi:DNA repair exonuclease SbcCD ATPase subunit
MLKSLELKNFQRHKYYKLEFDRVTTIIGPSDSGKSAIIRALRFVAFNRPNNKRIIKHGASCASVRLHVAGKSILRKRGNRRTNLYRIDSKTFRAIGSKVPDAIASILNLSEVNFQKQLDLHFWFADTPGQVSKALNQIVNLGKIDTSLAYVANLQRKTKAKIEVLQDSIADLKSEKSQLDWVPRFLSDLSALSAIFADMASNGPRIALLASCAESMANSLSARARAANAIIGASNAVQIGSRAIDIQNRRMKLKRLVSDLSHAIKLTNLPIPDLNDLNKQRIKADAIADKNLGLFNLIQEIREANKNLCEAKASLEVEARQLEKVTKGKCPTCGKESSQFLAVTYTSQKRHLSPVQRRKIGLKCKHDT